MTSKTLRNTVVATAFAAALGVAGAGQALAHPASPASGAAQTDNGDTTMGQKVTDTWITTKVKTEFATTKGVSATDISVDTKDGVVVLTGNVKTDAEKQLAIRTARSVKGVKAVEAGHLEVSSQ